MKELIRGEKVKLLDYTSSLLLEVEVKMECSREIDIICFGLDGEKKLSDDRYTVFYNQTQSPNREIQLLSHRSGYGSFVLDLTKLPANVQNLVFTAAIDGNGTMSMIENGSIVISSGGQPILHYQLKASDFHREKSIIISEIYFKSGWKAAAVGKGFNAGLNALIKEFGGEIIEEQTKVDSDSKQKPPSYQSEGIAVQEPNPKLDQELDDRLPIYSMDVETRLMIDTLDFEKRNAEMTSLEKEAFLYFKKHLEEELENVTIDESNFSISMEHLQFKRYIEVLVKVISRLESDLNDLHIWEEEEDPKEVAVYAAALSIACHYRYPFGLYNDQSTVQDYIANKAAEVPRYEKYFQVQFQLATFCEDAEISYKHPFKVEKLTNYFAGEVDFSEENEEMSSAYQRIDLLLYHCFLESNGDWSYPQEREFSYWELKVMIGDLLAKLRTELRQAHFNDDEFEVKKLVYGINLVSNYFIGLNGGKPVKPSEIVIDSQLRTDYLNINLLGESMYNTSLAYADDVRILGTRGHGVAAERANHYIDELHGKDSELLGDDNSLNGPDRRLGDELIQTKYCNTGGKCISECFEDGKFRYRVNGKPMTIEVPKDKYDDAIKSMQERIRRGDMKDMGITDPEAAKDIIKKGNISYKTAQRIAKAGTIEGILYDSKTGVIQASQAFGISVSISFAQSIWRGEDWEEAVSEAMKSGSKVFGASLAQHIITKQLGRTAVEQSLRPMTDFVTKKMLGSKASAKIVNTFIRGSSQRAISGAAATNQLSKVLRGNIVTVAVTTAVMSSGHIYDAIEGRISGKQLFKNISTAGAGVGGAAIGASIGSVVPVVGTLVGGVVGGWIGGKVSKAALDQFIEDDAVGTYEKLKDVFVASVEELQLDREELNYVMDYVFDQKQMPKKLKLIYAADDREEYIETMMDPYMEAILKARPRVSMGTVLSI